MFFGFDMDVVEIDAVDVGASSLPGSSRTSSQSLKALSIAWKLKTLR